MATVARILHERRSALINKLHEIHTKRTVMRLRERKILERKRRLLSKIDNFSKLNEEERKMGLLSFMAFLGEEFETPSQTEVSDIESIPHDLIEENLTNDSFCFSDSE